MKQIYIENNKNELNALRCLLAGVVDGEVSGFIKSGYQPPRKENHKDDFFIIIKTIGPKTKYIFCGGPVTEKGFIAQ